MSPKFKKQTYISTLVIFISLISLTGFAQKEEDRFRILFGVGGNHASESGFAEPYKGKGLNIPTLNLGLQYMFKENLGARLDIGFNRIKGSENNFKTNYGRVNAQVVYDYSSLVGIDEKKDINLMVHTGLGYSIVKPLGGIKDNDDSYLNGIVGTEFLYAFNRTASAFFDVSYIHGFTEVPTTGGMGAFNGSMFTFTVGVSLSLSGCNYCN